MGGFNLTPVVKNLLLINILIFALDSIMELGLNMVFGFRFVTSDAFMPFQLFTYMFLHGGLWHLFFNMFGLFVFGPMVEQHFDSKKFLLLYMVAGLGAGVFYGLVNFIEVYSVKQATEAFIATPTPSNLASYLSDYAPGLFEANYEFINEGFAENPDSPRYISDSVNLVQSIYKEIANGYPMVGASGAVLGIMAAFGTLYPNMRLMLLFPPIPVKAKYLVAFYALFSVYSLIERAPGDNVAHLAHIGGMIFGFAFVKFSQRKN